MKKVKILVSMSGKTVRHPGQVMEVTIEEAERLTNAGLATVISAVPTDTTAYDAVVKLVPADNTEGIYTTPSWAEFETAIAECDITLTEEVRQKVIDAEIVKIEAALGLLEKVEDVDTDAYDTIVALVPVDNATNTYTAESWTLFEAAIADCDLTLTASYGQEAIDMEVVKIQTALDLLEETQEGA